MNISPIIWLLVMIGIAGVVFWYLQHVAIPQPFQWVVYLVFAVLAIWMLVQIPGLFDIGPLFPRR